MRVALVHDWLTGLRGGEKVLDALCELLPGASLFTLLHVPGSTSPRIESRRIDTSFVQHLPRARLWYRHYLPLFPAAVEQFDLDSYDLVVSCSHCVARAAVATGRARHLAYCLTPMRYAWDQFDAYFGEDRVGRARSAVLRPVMAALARWDRSTSGRADRYVAISDYVARRVAAYYNRRSVVVHPPVDTAFFTPDPSDFPPAASFLVVSALVPYKRVDIAIAAATRAKVPLTIVGDGPDRAALERSAGPNVTFVGSRTDREIRELYRRSAATLLPGEEDFGIVPVEAQACGRPVVALGRAGALDTVVDGVTGVLVADDSVDALADGMRTTLSRRWDTGDIRRHAERFGRNRFLSEMRNVLDETLAAPDGTRW